MATVTSDLRVTSYVSSREYVTMVSRVNYERDRLQLTS